MNNKTLLGRFQKLSASAVACDRDYAQAEHAIYDKLVEEYLFYLEVKDKPNFLDSLYEKEGIRGNQLSGNRTNFNPFVRVIFRLDLPNVSAKEAARQRLTPGSQKNRVAYYATAFEALDAEYTERSDDYRTNTRAKLRAFFDEHSIQGLIQKKKEANALKKHGALAESEKDVADTRKLLEDAAFSNLKNKQSKIGTAAISKSDGMRYTADGLTACIIRRDAKGSLQIVAASHDEAAMRTIAYDNEVRLGNIRAASLRTIAEVVATQSFPMQHIPAGNMALLTGALKHWHKNVYLEPTEKKKAFTNRRLVIRGKSVLLSAQRTNSSVVTILESPLKMVPKISDEYFMLASNIRTLEEWIENKTIVARTAKPEYTLGSAPKETKANYALQVENAYSGAKPTYLYFYNLHGSSIGKDSSGQVDFNENSYKPTWQSTVSNGWLQQLRNALFEKWFRYAASGNKIKRGENSYFKILVTPSKFSIGYELDATKVHPRVTVPLQAKLKGAASLTVLVSSKDFAPVFNNVCDLEINGGIELSGDKAAMVMRFATPAGAFTIAIPTITLSKKGFSRNAKHFSIFGAKGEGVEKR